MTDLLPSDVGHWWTTSVNYPQYDNTLQIDASSMSVSGYQLGLRSDDKSGADPGSIVVCRHKFRSWMVQNLPVQTNKGFSHCEEDSNGVTAHFQDGSNARGSILVGADGSSSAVRRQLLGRTRKELHTFVPICGSFNIGGDHLKRLRALASAGIVAANHNAQVMVSPLELDAGGEQAQYWWVAAFRSSDPEADTNWVHSASKEELFSKVLNIAEGMPDFTVETLKIAGAESVWDPQIRFSEYIAPDTLPKGRVTLLGDAAHNTTPYGGMGANTGINDAGDLGRMLIDQKWDTYEDVQSLLQQYNSVMLPRGQSVVLSSRAVGLDDSFGMASEKNENIIPWHETITTVQPGIPLDEYRKNAFLAVGN